MEFGGLLLNVILPLFNIKTPLSYNNVFYSFNISLLLLFILAWLRTKQLEIKIALPKCSIIEKALYTLPVFFPILATLGAIVLNNGGSNILTLILLAAIAGYSLLLVLFRDKIVVDLYPYALFFIGLASLFTTSLRSWYITGHDIEREFYVFQLTNTHHIWNMAFYQDPYNACLSITILPTILTHLLSIQDMYVYKVIFQILFATSPLVVFFVLRNYTKPILAFLSAFFFISFPTFFNDMAMLNRQEIGFIFFGLVLYTMLLSELSLSRRKILFIIFGFSTIVSHYSTNFVLLALVVFVYALTLIILLPRVTNSLASVLSRSYIVIKYIFCDKVSNSQKRNNKTTWYANEDALQFPIITQADHSTKTHYHKTFLGRNPWSREQLRKFHRNERKILGHRQLVWQHPFLSLPLILLLFSMTYFWNTVYTHSSNNTSSVISEVINSLLIPSNTNIRSSDLSNSIFFAPKLDPKQRLQDYINSLLQKANTSELYSKSITSKYPSQLIPQERLAPTPLGNLLSSFHIPVFNINAALRLLAAYFMQIFVLIGLLSFFFFKSKKPIDLQYLLLCFGAIFLLILITVLPALSIEYGVLRMFQQFLFILSLPIVLGLNAILFFVKEQKRIFLIGIIAIMFFLNLTGFTSHLTGDYYPQMALDNAGLYYDAYYVHKSDVLAIIWLSKNNIKNEPVESDLSGMNKLLTYGDVNALDEIFPPIIQKNTYVYLEVSSQRVVSIDKNILTYRSSKPFLDKYKDTVYSNGKDNIYN